MQADIQVIGQVIRQAQSAAARELLALEFTTALFGASRRQANAGAGARQSDSPRLSGIRGITLGRAAV